MTRQGKPVYDDCDITINEKIPERKKDAITKAKKLADIAELPVK